MVWDHFGTRADVISRRYPILIPLTLDFTLKAKCQEKITDVIFHQSSVAFFVSRSKDEI